MAEAVLASKRASAIQPRALFLLLALAALLLLPTVTGWLQQPFYLRFATRLLAYGVAAMSLDLILGFGGLVSFGHAAFVGVGAYTVGILAWHADDGSRLFGFIPGTQSAWIAWPAALACGAVAALLIGTVALRTRGVSFIMITLALAQMLYFLFVGLDRYGGMDGLQLPGPSTLALLDLADRTTLYYLSLAALVVCALVCDRVVRSGFGVVLDGCRQSERRMRALGVAPFRHQLAAFVIAGTLAAVSGVLLSQSQGFVSPADMAWTRSGELLIMVVLGGVGTLYGPILGAFVLLSLELVLEGWTPHWPAALGCILILVALFARRGLFGLIPARWER
jgi:branched-chain amino acid transport system permease protein